MRAMQFNAPGQPLELVERPEPTPDFSQIKLRVEACGICRTDLHLIDGDVPIKNPPRILGHQIVGRDADDNRFGVPWLGWTCGSCKYCVSGRENLCPGAQFTGCDFDGGFAEQVVVDQRFAFPLPEASSAAELAPLLCAGLIGYRSLRLCGEALNLGLYGFGSAAHLVTQVALRQGRNVFAFTRSGDTAAQEQALALGAKWAGSSEEMPPEELDAAIIFAPVGDLIPAALKAVAPGGVVVCGGIHMSEIPPFDYDLLWHERQLRSVANLTRLDGYEFLRLAPEIELTPKVTTYPLERANEALADLRAGAFTGAGVIVP